MKMAAESRRQPARTRRKKRRRRRRRGDRTRLWTVIVLVVIVGLGVVGTIAFDDRHWHAFDNAGDVAFERGNYQYAERMYDEALQVARSLEDPKLITSSLQALSRTYTAQGRHADAHVAARQAARGGG